jgi:uncharacterized membrane protein YfhO
MLRANYTLCALPIPEGQHEIVFKFDPPSIKITDTIAYIALAIMLLTAIVTVWKEIKADLRS